MVGNSLGVVITLCKDTGVMQVVSMVTKDGISKVHRRTSPIFIEIKFTKDIIVYQYNMGVVDRGD